MLRDTQFIDQHSAVGLLKTAIVTGRGDGAMQAEIGENDRIGIPPRKRIAKVRQTRLDHRQVVRRSPDGREIAYQWQEDIHRFVMINNVDELHRSDLGAAIRLKFDKVVRSKADQGL